MVEAGSTAAHGEDWKKTGRVCWTQDREKNRADLKMIKGRNRKITTKATERQEGPQENQPARVAEVVAATEERNAERTIESSFFIYSTHRWKYPHSPPQPKTRGQ
jgi:hypothetical protein